MRLNFRDKMFFNGLRVCGNMNPNTSKAIITENRIRTFTREHLIERVSYQDNHISRERTQTAYRLTEKGRVFCEKEFRMSHFQSNRGCERHNCAVYDVYSRLSNSERMSAMNEIDIKDSILRCLDDLYRNQAAEELDRFLEQTKGISLIDMTYMQETEGFLIGIEIATDNYSQTVIEQKEACATLIQCHDFQVINIH